MAYPIELTGSEISDNLRALIRELAARLLSGNTPSYAILRNQLATAQIQRITLTGAGLFADLHPRPDTPLVQPADLIGGEVLMEVEGLDAPAGSLIKIAQGRLAFVEIYTYGDVPWPDHPNILAFGAVTPVSIPAPAS